MLVICLIIPHLFEVLIMNDFPDMFWFICENYLIFATQNELDNTIWCNAIAVVTLICGKNNYDFYIRVICWDFWNLNDCDLGTISSVEQM